jgi:hypothetical protein
VPLHHTGIAATLADCRHIHGNNIVENIDGQCLSDGKTFNGNPKFLDEFLRFAVRFGSNFYTGNGALLSAFAFDCRNVSPFGFSRSTSGFVFIADLDGFVTVLGGCPQLQYIARTRLNYRYRNDLSGFRIKLRTSDFSSQ